MWFNKYGLVTNSDGGTSGNDILYTAHYVAGLYLSTPDNKWGDFDWPEELEEIYYRVGQCRRDCTMGLYNRLPGFDVWYQSHDDYMGLLSMCSFLNPTYRQLSGDIYAYGLRRSKPPVAGLPTFLYHVANALAFFQGPRWVYNNVDPDHFSVPSWRFRRPEVVATIKMAAGHRVGLVGWLYWAGFMARGIRCTDPADTNKFILRWHMALATRDSGNPLTRWIGNRLRKQIKVVYGDAGQMLKWYYGKDNAVEHPLVALLKGVA